MSEEYNKSIERVKPSGLELIDRLVGVNRVTKVTKGGRAFGFSAIVVEVSEAIVKAIEDAKKNLIRVPLVGSTVPHAAEGKFSGASVFIRPASHGTGVIAGGSVRAVLETVGIKDVLSKSKGSCPDA